MNTLTMQPDEKRDMQTAATHPHTPIETLKQSPYPQQDSQHPPTPQLLRSLEPSGPPPTETEYCPPDYNSSQSPPHPPPIQGS